uniref:(California timema) hypothetical protein n=1 Tax=Timema californicum TaxID=61474 RepID=A0A7R9J641_TIMCA|nr:unnamed protein product [Timema californicum]
MFCSPNLKGELSSVAVSASLSLSADVADWNPFEDATPFNQLTEDHIFGAEFDKIRRGSQSSISNVKSRESLVMACTELGEDPFSSAPFSLPGASSRFQLSRSSRQSRLIYSLGKRARAELVVRPEAARAR